MYQVENYQQFVISSATGKAYTMLRQVATVTCQNAIMAIQCPELLYVAWFALLLIEMNSY